jgi:hypothetical protein
MKKKLILIIGLIGGLYSFAQTQRSTEIFNEDFSSGVPPTNWTIEGIPQQWSQEQSTNAGGTAPEAQLQWINGNNSTYLISPETDLTGVSSVLFSFNHYLNDYSGSGYTIGVATRSGGGSWNNVWTVNPTGDIGPEGKSLLVSNSDVGASDFQICLFLSGNTYNFDYWYIDDINLLEPDNNDISMQSVDVLPYAEEGNVEIVCTASNIGLSGISSFDLNYQVDGGTIVTENVSGLNLQTTDSYSYTFSQDWTATAGNYVVDVWASDINGSGDDDDTSNDLKSKDVSIATSSTQGLPFFESFTSSTCGPCAPFNQNVFNPFMDAHPYDIAVVKYQMSWPGNGDPYYTEEGGVRRNYYGVSFVPDLYTGGYQTATNAGAVNAAYNSEMTRAAFFDMSAEFTINGDIIDVNVDMTPYITVDMRVHIAVIEKETTGNVGNNGETSFEHVMMKMLPDADGTMVNFISDTPTSISESYDMSTTFVEEMDDLAVVVFIQDDATKTIMQTYYASGEPLDVNDSQLDEIRIYPNPSDGLVNINTTIPIEVDIYDVLGKKVYTSKMRNTKAIDLSYLNNGVYVVKLTDGTNQSSQKLIIQN